MCGALFFGGEGIEEDALAGGLEAAAGKPLEDAAGDEHGKADGEAAEGGSEGEDEDREEEVIAPAEAERYPAGDGEDDGVGGEVGGDDPIGIGLGGGESAGDVAECDVGDGGVEDFHEGRDHDGGGDEPGVDRAAWAGGEGGLCGAEFWSFVRIFDFRVSIFDLGEILFSIEN